MVWRIFHSLCMLITLAVIGNTHVVAQEDKFTFKKLLMPGAVIEGHKKFEHQCGKCHETFKDITQPTLCLDCHKEVREDINKAMGYHGLLKNAKNRECKECHGEHLGRKGDIINLDKDTFNHQHTDFKLIGSHMNVECTSCHLPDKKYREAPKQCVSCHKRDDQHRGAMGKDCQNCHSPKRWTDTKFDHSKTEFALLGKHKETQCNACHPDERYKNTPQTCISCHAVNDVHRGKNGEQCSDCHVATGWKKISFDHNRDTQFKLNGGHKNLSCSSCHETSGIEKNSTKCVDCHKSDDEHSGRNGQQCDSCHNTNAWDKLSFDHARDTQFSLEGRHAELTCNSCHRGEIKANDLSSECIDCHKSDDVHNGEEGKQCNDCHKPTGWRDQVRFNHELTRFPLVGMHAVATCESCHDSKQFQNTSNQCIDCHQKDDVHKRSLGENCGDCHNPNDWQLWIFNHNTQTQFKLDGAHKGLSCGECHVKPTKNKVKQNASCVTCHLNDDVHNRRFGRSCERCHSTESFKDIRM